MDCKGVKMVKLRLIIGVLITIVVLAGTTTGVQAQSDDGLVADWHFDEGSGSVLKDSSRNGNDGVIYGATWVEGKYGGALSFDGVDDYVEFTYDSDFTPGKNSWTIEVWVKAPSKSTDMSIISWYRCGANPKCYTPDSAQYHLSIDENNKACWVVRDDNGNVYNIISHSSVADNSWHFLAVTFSSSSDFAELHMDGQLSNKTSATLTSLSDGGISIPFEIGRIFRTGWGSPNNYFNGIIDEVRIYNRALTEEEIKLHYEGKQTTLSLTKSAAPYSIKQGQTTTVTLNVTNTGTTEINDIEVSDTIPSDLTFISGETSKTYFSLRPKDSREFQYTLQLNEAGTYNLDPATSTYADEEGNYHTVKSKTAAITVIPSLNQPDTPEDGKGIPGFAAVVAITGLLAVYMKKRR